MNSTSKWLRFLSVSLSLLVALAPYKAGAQDYNNGNYQDSYNDGSYQDFYNDLSPYGEWIQDQQYGYVWVPDAGADFRPYYTNGYWVNTEYGNTWVSDYPWGWAAFHYGRWTYDEYYGWIWIPGDEWGPAWVTWRGGGGYYGWAPMGPGVSVDLAFGGWNAPYSWWIFTPQQYILNPRFHQYCRPGNYNRTIVNQTTVINNSYGDNRGRYVAGPNRQDIEHATGRSVKPLRFSNAQRPASTQVRGNEVAMYRPSINRNGGRPPRVAQEQRPIATSPREISAGQPGRISGRDISNGQRDDIQPRPVIDPRTPGRDQPVRQPDRTYRQPSQQPAQQPQPVTQPARQQPQRDWRSNGGNRPQYQNNPVQQPRQQVDRPQRNVEPQRQPIQPQQPVQQPQRTEQPRPVQQDRSFQQPKPVEQPTPAQEAPVRSDSRPDGIRRR